MDCILFIKVMLDCRALVCRMMNFIVPQKQGILDQLDNRRNGESSTWCCRL